ncbi:unnamed protein product [Merluccius merluccius]
MDERRISLLRIKRFVFDFDAGELKRAPTQKLSPDTAASLFCLASPSPLLPDPWNGGGNFNHPQHPQQLMPFANKCHEYLQKRNSTSSTSSFTASSTPSPSSPSSPSSSVPAEH